MTNEELADTLRAAGSAHHEYETVALGGERDEQWPGWYAAFVLGAHRGLTTPSELSRLLADAPTDASDWATSAAHHVVERLGA